MRIAVIIVACLFLVACMPEPEGKGVVNGIKQSKEETGRLVGQAITGDFGVDTCVADMDCDLGHMCVNETCVLKKR